MQKELIFGILAFLITAWGISVYWRGVVRREIIPHPFTFFIWVVVLGISSIELIMRQEVLGSLAIALSTLSAAGLVYIGARKCHLIETNWLDWFFLISGICLILLWRIEPNYTYVLAIMIAIDAMAYASTFKKGWLQPWTERSSPYLISVVNNLCTIFAISVWNFENLGMWIWTAGINFTFACFILVRQYYVKK